MAEVIDEFRAAGVPFAYSTALVDPAFVVEAEPTAAGPLAIVQEILAPHGLTVQSVGGVYVIVRSGNTSARPAATGNAEPAGESARQSLENIVVSASRYEFARETAGSRFGLDQRSIQDMPDVGEDPLRVVHRLPGAAASGASARSHFRGGNADEVGIMLNGQWLFDPFHVRDYQSVFSAVDARAISGVEVYTGGFPVRWGDRMSGLVLMESKSFTEPRHTEIGLSVFNTSFLTSAASDNKRWLVSARRGNLDLVIDPKFGEPSYYDFFAEYAIDLSDRSTLSGNLLYADDSVRLVVENDPEELEQVTSTTQNAQAWLQLRTQWTDELSSATVLSATRYDNLRVGSTNDAEKMIATVRGRSQRRPGKPAAGLGLAAFGPSPLAVGTVCQRRRGGLRLRR